MHRIFRILLATGAILAAGSAFAHHSRAMFDQAKQITLAGTVKDFSGRIPIAGFRCLCRIRKTRKPFRSIGASRWVLRSN
jgi:Family of unknown function (DUF6152)